MPGFALASLLVRRALLAVVAFAMLGVCYPALAAADGIEVTQASLDATDDGWVVNAQFDMTLKPRLEEWLEGGQPLYFVVDFELTQPRWYWFDDKTATASRTYRVSYYPLTREYRVSTGTLQVGFATLAEALAVLTRVHDWRVMDRPAIHAGETYIAGVRMYFDRSQLPRPIQINALTTREWTMDSDWKHFSFEVTR
jgi:hypothetical protein